MHYLLDTVSFQALWGFHKPDAIGRHLIVILLRLSSVTFLTLMGLLLVDTTAPFFAWLLLWDQIFSDLLNLLVIVAVSSA